MNIMYDSTRAKNIPADAEYVAGYLDQVPGTGKIAKWSQPEWDRFTKAKLKIRLVKNASTNAGDALDVEERLAKPGEAPGWVKKRRAAGTDPIVYCNMATWPAVIRAFNAADVAHPHYWIARYDGIQNLPSIKVDGKTYNAFAKQYADDQMLKQPYDKTCFNEWAQGSAQDMDKTQDNKLTAIWDVLFHGSKTAGTTTGLAQMIKAQGGVISTLAKALANQDNNLTADAIEAACAKAIQENVVTVEIHGNEDDGGTNNE